MVLVWHGAAVVGVRRMVSEESEILCASNRGGAHEPNRLPRVDTLDRGDVVGARLDQIGNPVQDLLPFLARATGPIGERLVGCVGGRVDVGRIA